jgi:hypothetical protein
MPLNFNCITMNFTLNWLQQQEFIDEHMPWWLIKIILEMRLLRLTYISYLGFFAINNNIKFMFYNFLNI